MNKKTKGIFIGLLMLIAIFLSACTDPYANVYVEFESANTRIEIVLGETPNNSITLVSTIKNYKSGMSDLMFFSPDRSVLKVESTRSLGNGRTQFTLLGLKPGTVLLKAQTLEGGKFATLEVKVLQPMTSFSVKPESKPYLMRGMETTIYPLEHINFFPLSTTEKNILAELKDYDQLAEQGVVFENNIITIPELFDQKTITFVYSAYQINDGIKEKRNDIPSQELSFSVISPITQDDIQLYSGANAVDSITLLSNHPLYSQSTFIIEVLSSDFEEEPLEEFVSFQIAASDLVLVSNVSVNKSNGARIVVFTLQTNVKFGNGNLVMTLNYLTNHFSISKSFPVSVQVISERIEVNEKQLFQPGEFVSTYTSYTSMSGSPLHFMIYPNDAASKYSNIRIDYPSAQSGILLYSIMGTSIVKPNDLSPQEFINGRRIDSGIVLFDTYFQIPSSTTVYVRGSLENEELIQISAYIPLNELFDEQYQGGNEIPPIFFQIPVKVVKGAGQILMNNEVSTILGENGEVEGYEKEFTFATNPADAYTDDYIIHSTSNLASFTKLPNKTFKLTPFAPGEGTFTLYLSNGTQQSFPFKIVSNLKTDSVKLDVEESESIGFKNLSTIPMQFAIKFTMKANLKVFYEPANASVLSIQYSSSQEDLIYVNHNSGVMSANGVGGQNQKIVIMANVSYLHASYDDQNRVITEIKTQTVFIHGESYIPLKSFTMSRSSVQIYDFNTVGFYNKELSQASLKPVFVPANATYQNFTATDQSASVGGLSKFLIAFSNPNYHISSTNRSTTLEESLLDIFAKEKRGEKPTIYTEYMRYNYDNFTIEAEVRPGYLPSASAITFTVKEFNSQFSFSVEFAPLLQAKVENIHIKNLSEGQEIYLDANRQFFQIVADAEPLESFNRTLRYAFFPPLGGGDTASVSVSNTGLVRLEDSNQFGRGFIRVSAEDSYSSSIETTRYIDIPVRVANGDENNPYSLRTVEDIKNIKGDGLSKFYVLESNINLGNESWVPLGIFTGGITGNGLYTISGIKLDNMSVDRAQKTSDRTILDDYENNLQNAPRIRVGLFTKIRSQEIGDGEYRGGYIRNVNFIGSIDISNGFGSLLLDVGLIAGQNQGEISRSTVGLTSAKVSLATSIYENQTRYYSRVGGMVGLNVGKITNYNIAENGEEVISSRVGVTMLGEVALEIAGIQVMAGMIAGQQGEMGKGYIPDRLGLINWKSKPVAFENEFVTAIANVTVLNSLTYAVGGLVGVNLNSNLLGASGIRGARVSGRVFGHSNVGGVVGINKGILNDVMSSVLVSAALNGMNVGGLTGHHTGTIQNSSVQTFYKDTTDGEVVRGYDAVGGLAGYMTEGIIENSYFVSYAVNPTKANVALSGTAGGSVGGLVGKLEAGTLRTVFSHATVLGNGSVDEKIGSLIGIIYNQASILIEDFYVKSNHDLNGTTTLQPIGAQDGTWGDTVVRRGYSYYDLVSGTEHTKYSNGNETTSVYDSTVYFGVKNAIENIAILNAENNWHYTEDADRPLLKLNGVIVNVDAPTDLDASVIKNKLQPIDGGLHHIAWVEFYQAVDASKQSLIQNQNQFVFGDYFQASYLGNNPLNATYLLYNNNSEILSIDTNGLVKILKTGLARISLLSKYNPNDKLDLYVYVVHAAKRLDVFVGADFSGKLGDRVMVTLKNNETRKLYAQTNVPSLQLFEGNQAVTVEIVKNNAPNLVAVETTPNMTDPSIVFGFHTDFFYLMATKQIAAGSFTVSAVNALQLGGKTYQSHITNASKLFQHNITVGAKGISTSTANIVTVPYFNNQIKVDIETDDSNDKIEMKVSQKTGSNSYLLTTAEFLSKFKAFPQSYRVENNKIYLNTVQMLEGGVFQNKIEGTLQLELKEEQKYIEEITIFEVQFVASNGLQYAVNITIQPQPVLDINVSQFNQLSSSSPSSERSNIITPGVTAAFTININPIYASFDYLDIVSSSPSAVLIALSVIHSTSTQNAILLPNGIRLTRSLVKYLVDNHGRVKIGILCASNVPDNSVISVQVYTVKNNVSEPPKLVEFVARNSVKVTRLEVQGIREGNNNILLQGVEYPLLLEVTGNPDNIEFVSNQAYEITKRNGNYFLIPHSNVQVNASTDVTVQVSKIVDTILYTSTASIPVRIAKAAVLNAPVKNIDYGKKVIRTPKGNAMQLDAEFDLGNSILYNPLEWGIDSNLDLLTLQAQNFAVWEYAVVGQNNWQRLKMSEISTESFLSIGNSITILQDNVPYQFRMRIRVAYDFRNNATSSMPVIVAQNTTMPADLTYVDKELIFTFEVFENTSTLNAIPVRTQSDLMNMEDNKHYILLSDIFLNGETFAPITAKVASFNGNNKKIYLPSNIVAKGTQTIDYALFAEVQSGALIQNVTIALQTNVTVQVSDQSSFTTFQFAGIAIRNFGAITNSEVISLHNINHDLLSTNEPYRIFVEVPSAGKNIFIAGLVIHNGSTGTITNSRVEASLLGPMNVAGFVHENAGKIASSYVKNATMSNYDAINAMLSGFVNKNNYTGQIFSSFVEGGMAVSYAQGTYTMQTMHSTLQKVESIDGNAAAFISDNSGQITDSFANITTIAKNYASGFVYENKQGAIIKNSFSLSYMQPNNNAATAFVGRNEVNRILNDGTISSSAYYMDESLNINHIIYPNTNIIGLRAMTRADFTNRDHEFYQTYSISTDNQKTKGVWFVPSGGFERDFVITESTSMLFFANRPHLVSPNILSRSEYVMDSYQINANGVYEYSYRLISNYAVGSTYHPYIVNNQTSFYDYLLLNADSFGRVNKNYRLVADIDFTGSRVKTSHIVFNGDIEGNGMKLINLVLESEATQSFAGFFASIGDKNSGRGSIKNLSLAISKYYLPNTLSVGGLAGAFYAGNLANISVSAALGSSSVVGRNAVGGLIGYTQILRESRLFNLTSSITAIALHQKGVTSFDINDSYQTTESLSVYSYAGAMFGILFNQSLYPIIISDLRITGTPYVIADNVGLISGFIGKGVKLTKLQVEGNQNMFLRASRTAGVMVGELVSGTIDAAFMSGMSNHSAMFETSTSWPFYAGGIAGVVRGGIIQNSTANVQILILSNRVAGKKTVVGGIAGLVNPFIETSRNATGSIVYTFKNEAKIVNNTNQGTIRAEVIGGGIVGTTEDILLSATIAEKTLKDGTKDRLNKLYRVEISHNINNGRVESAPNNQSMSIVGGIVGTTGEETLLTGNVNKAEVIALATHIAIAGGIVGEVSSSTLLDNANFKTGDLVVEETYNLTNAHMTRVARSFNTGKITAKNANSGDALSAGGIIGRVGSVQTTAFKHARATISFAYNHGTVQAEGRAGAFENGVGGIVGEVGLNGQAYLSQTYNVGSILNTRTTLKNNANAKILLGGIAGRGSISFRDASLIASETEASFYLSGVPALGSSASTDWAVALSQADMKNATKYVKETKSWNFTTRWQIDAGSSYPVLR